MYYVECRFIGVSQEGPRGWSIAQVVSIKRNQSEAALTRDASSLLSTLLLAVGDTARLQCANPNGASVPSSPPTPRTSTSLHIQPSSPNMATDTKTAIVPPKRASTDYPV
jgi:hypothetical protein